MSLPGSRCARIADTLKYEETPPLIANREAVLRQSSFCRGCVDCRVGSGGAPYSFSALAPGHIRTDTEPVGASLPLSASLGPFAFEFLDRLHVPRLSPGRPANLAVHIDGALKRCVGFAAQALTLARASFNNSQRLVSLKSHHTRGGGFVTSERS